MDVLSKSQRKYCMSKIQSEDTTPEKILRKLLWKHGYRYRLHYKKLPGKPDIVFVGRKKVIFVNGCFWHHHSCKFFVWPKTHSKFWKNKIDKNVDRDAANISNLKNMGWDVLVIWECELKNDIQNVFLKKVVPFLD